MFIHLSYHFFFLLPLLFFPLFSSFLFYSILSFSILLSPFLFFRFLFYSFVSFSILFYSFLFYSLIYGRVKEHQTSTGGNGNKDDPKNNLNNNDDCYYNDNDTDNDKKSLMNPDDDTYDYDLNGSIDNYDLYDSVSIQGVVETESSPHIRRKVSISSEMSAASDISSLVSVARAVSLAAKKTNHSHLTTSKKVPSGSVNSDLNYDDSSRQTGSGSVTGTGSRKLLLRNKQSILDTVPLSKTAPRPSPAPSPSVKAKTAPIHHSNSQDRLSKSVGGRSDNRKNGISDGNGYNDNENDLGMFKIQHHTYSQPTKQNTKYYSPDLLRDDHDNNSVSDFDNYEARSHHGSTDFGDNYNDNDLNDDFENEFGNGIQNLGDTATIQRSVGLLRAHKLSISEMVEVRTYNSITNFT